MRTVTEFFLTDWNSAKGITIIAVASALTVILGVGAISSYLTIMRRRRESLRRDEEWHHPTDRI